MNACILTIGDELLQGFTIDTNSTWLAKTLLSYNINIIKTVTIGDDHGKIITTGEGGMLITNNQDLLDEVNIYKHDGRRERGIDVIERLGYNFRITELQTAIGVAQYERLSTIIEKKIENNELLLKDVLYHYKFLYYSKYLYNAFYV